MALSCRLVVNRLHSTVVKLHTSSFLTSDYLATTTGITLGGLSLMYINKHTAAGRGEGVPTKLNPQENWLHFVVSSGQLLPLDPQIPYQHP